MCITVATKYVPDSSADAHTASSPLCLCFVPFQKTVLVWTLSASTWDAPELSRSSSFSGESLSQSSFANKLPFLLCASGAVEVRTLCLQAAFTVSKTCLTGKLETGMATSSCHACFASGKPCWIDLAVQMVVSSTSDCYSGGHSVLGYVKKPSVEEMGWEEKAALTSFAEVLPCPVPPQPANASLPSSLISVCWHF